MTSYKDLREFVQNVFMPEIKKDITEISSQLKRTDERLNKISDEIANIWKKLVNIQSEIVGLKSDLNHASTNIKNELIIAIQQNKIKKLESG